MKRNNLHVPILILLSLLLAQAYPTSAQVPPQPPPEKPSQAEVAIQASVQAAIVQAERSALAYSLFETRIHRMAESRDRTWAAAWITPADPDTGEVISAEPGLALLRKAGGEWQTWLPYDPDWEAALRAAPSDLLTEADKQVWIEMYAVNSAAEELDPFGGYLLPWAKGQKIYLTRSISHYSTPDPSKDMHYSFDFAAPWFNGSSPMFEVHASKAGTVKRARWTQPNGSEDSPGNYLVLEDLTTTPPTYQLYLHLAQNTIPERLRVTGAPVAQGEYIGLADDTGMSTGNHLHFQVHTNPISYWGKAVDITFQDVSINWDPVSGGGRPRTKKEAVSYPQYGSQGLDTYISQNEVRGDVTGPSGDLLTPSTGQVVKMGSLRVEGWASDADSGLKSAQLIARWGDQWQEIGPPFSASPFTYDWDLCASAVPDGPVSLAVRAQDQAGNTTVALTGLRHLIKDYECAPRPPVCSPGPGQAALFSEPDLGGDCLLLEAGEYTTAAALGALGNDRAVSVQVGANAQVTMWAEANLSGRGQTFAGDGQNPHIDSNLSDDRIGAATVSSVRVSSLSQTPRLPIPVWPPEAGIFPGGASLSLAWNNGGEGLAFTARLIGPSQTLTRTWDSATSWPLGSLPSGKYTWQVKARNRGGESAWSSIRTFTVGAAPPTTHEPASLPYSMTAEAWAGWSDGHIQGQLVGWDLTDTHNHTPQGRLSWWYGLDGVQNYDNGKPNGGDLTSPPIQLPPDSRPVLRFWYRYETEGPGTHWDQRWVQIAREGGPFVNLLQLSDDPASVWLQSPAVDLSEYAGSVVQVRFLFETLDQSGNRHAGWFVDDLRIEPGAEEPCPGEENSLKAPVSIQYGERATGILCPGGDMDFYRFEGQAGDQIGARLLATLPDVGFDPTLALLDGDGTSVLVENDDMQTVAIRDSFLSYRLSRDGEYLLRVRPWNHPSAGGADFAYQLDLFQGAGDPAAGDLSPVTGSLLPGAPFSVTVSTAASALGISHVDFFWHSADWVSGSWEPIGSDWNPQDGWRVSFNTLALPDQNGGALYARIYDWAGNSSHLAAWNLSVDHTPLFLPMMLR